MKPTRTVVIAALVLAGCTPKVYKEWADSQVGDILRDRKETTLGYTPQTEAETTIPATPSKSAYAKIPVTPLPPPVPPPFEPMRVDVPPEPLGPPVPTTPEQQREADPDPYANDLSVHRSIDRYRLGPMLPADLAMRLDLFRALTYAVENSRQYRTQMEDVYLSTLDVTLQRHLFSPRPFVNVGSRWTAGRANQVDYRAARTVTATAGVRQRLPLGGEVTAQTLVEAVDAIRGNVAEGESAAVALNATVPLLRGFGLVNLEPLIQSERRLVYQIRAFEQFRRSFLVQISSAYFDLLTQQQQLANSRLNYANLAALTARTQALYDAGRISFLEVQRSAQALLRAESNLIDAEDRYQTALDNFKIVIGMPIQEDLDVIPVELDVLIPEAEADEAIRLAAQYRLDLQTARDQIEDARRAVDVAKNGLLPDLDVTGNYRIGNQDDPLFDLRDDTATYGAGITLNLPVDRLSERNTYRRTLILLQRAQRNYEELQDRIGVAARDALRSIRNAQTNLEIQRLGIELAQRRYDYANELLRSPVATGRDYSRDVVEAQDSLLSAQNAYARARAALQVSVLNYLRDTGTLRVDPLAGALGRAMDRGNAPNVAPIE